MKSWKQEWNFIVFRLIASFRRTVSASSGCCCRYFMSTFDKICEACRKAQTFKSAQFINICANLKLSICYLLKNIFQVQSIFMFDRFELK